MTSGFDVVATLNLLLVGTVVGTVVAFIYGAVREDHCVGERPLLYLQER